MKNFKVILASSFVLITFVTIYGQQEAMFTHYMHNTLVVNPAYAGSRGALTMLGLHRSQWVSFDGAPITQTISAHSPIFNGNLGVGASVIRDKIGPTGLTSFNVDIAYRLRLTSTSVLAFGLKGGISSYSANLTTLLLNDYSDHNFSTNVSGDLMPNVGFGVCYYHPQFYVGLSSPRLLQNKLQFDELGNAATIGKENLHYYLIAGYTYALNSNIVFKPSTLVKVTKSAPLEADLTASFLFDERLSLGLMFRTRDAAGVLAGYNISEQLYLGYSFDWSFLNTTSRYNAGSHEVLLRYDLIFKNESKIKSPRYF